MKRPLAGKRPVVQFAQALTGLPEIIGVYNVPERLDSDTIKKIKQIPSVNRAEYNPEGVIEVVFRYKKGTYSDVQGTGIDLGSLIAVKKTIENEEDIELSNYDVEVFSIPQQRRTMI